MFKRFIECVANFSEGRDPAKIGRLVAAVETVTGAYLLDRHSDPDHNRTVLTFAGHPEAVAEAAFRAVAAARDIIDLTVHSGVHPRIGAADVIPFVPLEPEGMEECVRWALVTGARIWSELAIPVYLYGEVARRPDRKRLENIRRGGFEKLREMAPLDPSREPDIGGPELHPTAGAAIVGARPPLIAFNVNLNSRDLEAARRIAARVRQSGGGLPGVKALGVFLASRNQVQVTMNLTDIEATPIEAAFQRVAAEAAAEGLAVTGSEVVGLVPRRALLGAAAVMLGVENFHPGMVLENQLEEKMRYQDALSDFTSELAGPAGAPAGGTAAAAAGAMAAALAEKVARRAGVSLEEFSRLRTRFVLLAREDADAYREVLAMLHQKDSGSLSDFEPKLQRATEIPLEIAELAFRMGRLLDGLAPPDRLEPEYKTARALAAACFTGAITIVRANLEQISSGEFHEVCRRRMENIGAG